MVFTGGKPRPPPFTSATCAFCSHMYFVHTPHAGRPDLIPQLHLPSTPPPSPHLRVLLLSFCFVAVMTCVFRACHTGARIEKNKTNRRKCDAVHVSVENWKPMAWCYVKNPFCVQFGCFWGLNQLKGVQLDHRSLG